MAADDFESARRAMVASQLRTVGVEDPRLIAALAVVPRESFVPPERRAIAYSDRAIDLGDGRTLNPPEATARLLDAAAIAPGDRVLIVGSDTGYAAAVARLLADDVMTADVTGRPFDWPKGPFDAIVIDGAVEQVPDALVDALAKGGRMAAAIVDRGVTRLALGRRGGAGFALVPFADAHAVRLPGFDRPRAFVF